MFISNDTEKMDEVQQPNKDQSPSLPENTKKKGCKVMKPRYQIQDAKRKGGVLTNFLPGGVLTNAGMQSLPATSQQPQTTPRVATPQVTTPKVSSIPTKKAVKSWEVCLSESSGSENETEN